jgi:hypothetical protein
MGGAGFWTGRVYPEVWAEQAGVIDITPRQNTQHEESKETPNLLCITTSKPSL